MCSRCPGSMASVAERQLVLCWSVCCGARTRSVDYAASTFCTVFSHIRARQNFPHGPQRYKAGLFLFFRTKSQFIITLNMNMHNFLHYFHHPCFEMLVFKRYGHMHPASAMGTQQDKKNLVKRAASNGGSTRVLASVLGRRSRTITHGTPPYLVG